MSTVTTQPIPVVYHVVIHLADNEWGNRLMAEVAKEYFDEHPELDPLEVEVYEHAGWTLTFTRDMGIVHTANDAATLSLSAREFNAKYYHSGRIWLPGIRRENAACKQCGRKDVDVIGNGICSKCRFPS